jgi:hypothetical protein
VMPPPSSRPRTHAYPCRKKHSLPAPRTLCIEVASSLGLRQMELSEPSLQVLLVQGTNAFSMCSKKLFGKGWKHHHPIRVPLSSP